MIFECPLQTTVSFGQCSFNILKEFFKLGLTPNVFPISSNIDISSFEVKEDFKKWLEDRINKAVKSYNRTDVGLRFWHINGSFNNVSSEPSLFTMHETDTLTEYEQNILKNHKTVFVSSNYTKGIFEKFGVKNVVYCPLGFDAESFKETNKKYLPNVTVWGLYGKMELRKSTLRVIKEWCKKFGNRNDHALHAAVFNNFLKPEDQKRMLTEALEGKQYRNLNLIPYTSTNKAYNEVLNAANIVIGMSGGEGFDLPFFQSLCLGKHAVCLKAHVYEDYTNENMVTYVTPKGMRDVYDNIFFHPNQTFNQGKIFDYQDEDLSSAFDLVFDKYRAKSVNEEGRKLKEIYTWEKTSQIVLENLKKV